MSGGQDAQAAGEHAEPGGRKKLPGGLTGNALATGIICVLLSGVISFFVARWQAQEANNQASTAQQAAAILQLETDARAFVLEADHLINMRRHCAAQVTPTQDCTKADTTPVYDSPMVSLELTLGTDLVNISDVATRKDTYILEGDTLQGMADAVGKQARSEQDYMAGAYAALLARCGQLVQGRPVPPLPLPNVPA